MRLFRSFLKDMSGATAVEYGLIIALIGVTFATGLGTYYGAMNNMFGYLTNTYANAAR
ncbi:Flp family type IVb pilin [Rhizobium wenxiniae]|nr:Flp family type IVb pilin [Rhizobium wenxiniae]MBW9087046.1 Flp family type IVb pilin [Rhizobium wenxiniae]